MRRIFTFFLTFLLGMFVTALYAQTHTVSGTVMGQRNNLRDFIFKHII